MLIPLIVPAATEAEALRIAETQIPGFAVRKEYGAKQLSHQTIDTAFWVVYGDQLKAPDGSDSATESESTETPTDI